jgi:hypothetical protein
LHNGRRCTASLIQSDNDGDRIINRLEYALGGDPNVNDDILPKGQMQQLQILSVPPNTSRFPSNARSAPKTSLPGSLFG